jgi:putative transposase
MPSTYTSLHIHYVFGTKNRVPLLHDDWLTRIHDYIRGTVNSLGAQSLEVGGIHDHVHLLVGMPPTLCPADLMRDLKKSTSAWMKSQFPVPQFGWQDGYGGFSISPSAIADVRAYIRNQAEHHRTKSFREEMLAMLERAGIEVDMRYFD